MKYMMNETSTFHEDLYTIRIQYQSGALGKLILSEDEYYHDNVGTLGSYNPKNGKIDGNGWRCGLPPIWYPTPEHHGSSHGQLTKNFIEAILLDQKPIVDVREALNMTLARVIAHQSALKGGEWMKIPQYEI